MMEASWDVWRTAKTWTLLDASYICCGERPVTDDQRRQTKTAHPANIHAMARRLRAEVPSRVLRDGLGRVRERIFQAAGVWDFAKQNGFRLPWEESATVPPSSRAARIAARHEELKAGGNPHPTKTLAEEEGKSESWIRQQLARARKSR